MTFQRYNGYASIENDSRQSLIFRPEGVANS